MVIPLSNLSQGRQARIVWMALPDKQKSLLSQWGFEEGVPIACVHKGRGRGLSAYQIRHKVIALRPGDANGIFVKR
ncbi:MAG: ferrous iron transport protein A [Lachnospiraceae bacterium]|nr:ferrous iron transport protein A [Lachnospiraceae bacterium]